MPELTSRITYNNYEKVVIVTLTVVIVTYNSFFKYFHDLLILYLCLTQGSVNKDSVTSPTTQWTSSAVQERLNELRSRLHPSVQDTPEPPELTTKVSISFLREVFAGNMQTIKISCFTFVMGYLLSVNIFFFSFHTVLGVEPLSLYLLRAQIAPWRALNTPPCRPQGTRLAQQSVIAHMNLRNHDFSHLKICLILHLYRNSLLILGYLFPHFFIIMLNMLKKYVNQLLCHGRCVACFEV